ncbi:hypothetical protein [Shewanella fidelis]|uniref:hypothetical protein n=1 Tax=Shewanella fidelis TaxID=173509 RepID=UPI00048D35D2|nr:hypothetical protein [Shewanella fidelis]
MADGLGGIEQFIVQGTAGGIFNVVQCGEFGSGTYTDVMDDASEVAFAGASYLAPIPIFRVGKWIVGPRGPLFGNRYFRINSKSGFWNTGQKRIGWSRYKGQVHFERRVGSHTESKPIISIDVKDVNKW